MDRETLSLGLFAGGTAMDHASTLIGLRSGRLVEANPFTNILINVRLWAFFDLCLLGLLSYGMVEMYRRWDHPSRWVFLVFLVVVGITRSLAGIYNIIQLISVL